MKLHLTQSDDKLLINAYDAGAVVINHIRYEINLILTPEKVFTDWPVNDFDSLTEASFAMLAEIKPEVILLGTGRQHRFIHPKLVRQLSAQGIPVECMTTQAACSTYNILMSEGRNVAAALIL